ncbi:hypothetical protein D3C86_2133510 [compost metagenome]
MPGRALVELLETGGFEALGQAGGGVKGGRRGLEKIDQALVQLFVHGALQAAMAGVYRN